MSCLQEPSLGSTTATRADAVKHLPFFENSQNSNSMNIVKFKLSDGSTDCYVNLDAVVDAKPTDDGKVILHTSNLSLTVDMEQFEKAISEKDGTISAINSIVNRLSELTPRKSIAKAHGAA